MDKSNQPKIIQVGDKKYKLKGAGLIEIPDKKEEKIEPKPLTPEENIRNILQPTPYRSYYKPENADKFPYYDKGSKVDSSKAFVRPDLTKTGADKDVLKELEKISQRLKKM